MPRSLTSVLKHFPFILCILPVKFPLAAPPEPARSPAISRAPSDREVIASRCAGRLTVLPGRLKVARTLRLAGGTTVKFRAERSSTATQCLLRNEGTAHATLVAGTRLDLVALPGPKAPVEPAPSAAPMQGPLELQGPMPLAPAPSSPRFWDRDWRVLAPRLSIHCEFPRGITADSLLGELKRVLKAFDFIPARTRSVSVDEVFPPEPPARRPARAAIR